MKTNQIVVYPPGHSKSLKNLQLRKEANISFSYGFITGLVCGLVFLVNFWFGAAMTMICIAASEVKWKVSYK